MGNLTKWFRIADGSLFMIPVNKSKYVLLGVSKMLCNVLQGRIPIDDLLAELEREMLESFKLTEKRNKLMRYPHISQRNIFKATGKK